MKITAPVSKNQKIEGTIEDLTYEGLGVLKVDRYPLFVADALPGEQVKIVVTKAGKNFGYARCLERMTTSEDRVEVKKEDRRLAQAGIAPLQHMSYASQLAFKQHQIESLLSKAKLNIEVLPTLGMAEPYHYRNKAQIPVRMVDGQLETGFYRQHSHDLVPLEDYYIQDERIDHAIIVVRDLLREFGLAPYNEADESGIVRNIMVRQGYYSDDMMIGIITNSKTLPHAQDLIKGITSQLPNVKSIVHNVNNRATNVIMGPVTKTIYGDDVIYDKLLGNQFAISAQSFYQVNPKQTEKLYEIAIEKAQLTGREVVIDAYCGIGTISLAMARHAGDVFGVEVVPAAVSDAKKNAQLNHLDNVEFVANKAEYQMGKWQEMGMKPDVIVVDPPRKGLDETLIQSAAEMAPKRVVYVSCNPSTLVRDIQRFAEVGYHVAGPIQPVDQFPQTPHIESVTLLEKD